LRASASTYALSAPRLRRTLVAGQLALALVLSATAALFGVSLSRVVQVDPGFDAGHALSARVSAYASRYPTKADAVRFFNDLVGRVAALPGVTAAAAGSALPLTGSGAGTAVGVEGRAVPMADRPGAGWQTVTPGYFAAIGIPIRAGRDFTRGDLDRPTHQVIINQALARLLFGDENPIGRRLVLGPEAGSIDWHEIIGVAGDVRHASLTAASAPRAYDLVGQHWSRTAFVIARTQGDPYAAAALVRREVQQLDPQAPVFEVRSLGDILDDSIATRRLASAFAGGLAGLSVLLAAIGVYGLLTSTVAARMREFGIRRALGSSPAQIVQLIVTEGAGLAAVGIPIGVALTLAGGRLIESQLFGVQAGDRVSWRRWRWCSSVSAPRPRTCRPAAPRASIRRSRSATSDDLVPFPSTAAAGTTSARASSRRTWPSKPTRTSRAA
jgi:putative ABC transport system permease protein